MIAHNPLHRSGQAELPHPAPTLGDNAQAHERIRMTDASRQKPPGDIMAHPVPRQQPFELLQDRSRKGTKEAFAAKLAHHATVFDCETVRAGHCAIIDF